MGELVKLIISEVKMGHKVKQSLVNSRIDFFYYAFRNILLVSIPLVIISAFILGFNMPHGSARISSSDSLAISVPSSCTLSSSVDETHSASIVNGAYEDNIGRTTLTTFCNDKNGYSVYAIGDSLNSEGNNVLVSNINNNYDIPSGTATSGDTSNWALKLSLKAGDTSPTPPTIIPPFDNYTTVPANWTKVATTPSGTTDMEKGSSFTTTYATYISPAQHAGTYTGQVAYLLVHSYNDNLLPNEPYFMQDVANWKDDLVEDVTVQAIDKRDFKSYSVTKLKDEHIWMTQNLDFNINYSTTLDSTTTDLNVIYNAPTEQYAEYNDGYTESNGIIYYTPASTATTIDFTSTNVPGWQNSNTVPYTANKTDSTETGHASLGNYYNWSAAIASNNSSTLTQNTLSDISKNPKNSICPKGWRLPTISNQSETLPGSTNEFARLNRLYNNGVTTNDSGLIVSPVWFSKGGYTNGGKLNALTGGYYWSSTSHNNTQAYGIYFSNNSVIPNYYSGYGKQDGRPLRCIAR